VANEKPQHTGEKFDDISDDEILSLSNDKVKEMNTLINNLNEVEHQKIIFYLRKLKLYEAERIITLLQISLDKPNSQIKSSNEIKSLDVSGVLLTKKNQIKFKLLKELEEKNLSHYKKVVRLLNRIKYDTSDCIINLVNIEKEKVKL